MTARDQSIGGLMRALARCDPVRARILAPAGFLRGLPDVITYAETFARTRTPALDVAIIDDTRLNELDARVLVELREHFHCHYASEHLFLFHRSDARYRPHDRRPLDALLARIDEIRASLAFDRREHRPPSGRRAVVADERRAVVVTTFNRPAALQRSLPQLVALGPPVYVVDDGSEESARAANFASCREAGAAYLLLPENRGLATAMNIGLGYAMANPAVEWISYFQDDVDVDAEAMERIGRVEDRVERPLITGYDADEHLTVQEIEVGGLRVKLKRSSPAIHLHAHVEYWRSVMPIPSLYVGVPKRGLPGPIEDWWIVNWAPAALTKRGLLIPCLPGLVRTFLWHPDDSTWGNPNLPDPPLSSPLQSTATRRAP